MNTINSTTDSTYLWNMQTTVIILFSFFIIYLGDLLKIIEEAKKNNKCLEEKEIYFYFCQLVLAVKYLHENHILHRDIKIQNIFMTKEGLIKLGDFGISKKLEFTDDLA